MSLSTTAKFVSHIIWSQIQNEPNLTKITDIGTVGVDRDITDGSGDFQANNIWHEVGTLGSGLNAQLDLFNLSKTILGSTINVSFSGGTVKGMVVENRQTTSGADIAIVATGSNPFADPFYGGTGLTIYPSGSQVMMKPLDGWAVGTTNRYLYLNDVGGSGSQYAISIIGTSG